MSLSGCQTEVPKFQRILVIHSCCFNSISGVTSNESTNNTHKRERVVETDKGESSQGTKTYADPHVNNSKFHSQLDEIKVAEVLVMFPNVPHVISHALTA